MAKAVRLMAAVGQRTEAPAIRIPAGSITRTTTHRTMAGMSQGTHITVGRMEEATAGLMAVVMAGRMEAGAAIDCTTDTYLT